MISVRTLAPLAAFGLLTACGGGGSSYAPPGSATPPPNTPAAGSLTTLNTIVTIGSTVDAGSGAGAGDNNPYGLTIAPTTAGLETAGDLIVCNFNNAANTQGAGTTIEDLKPTPGATPTRIAQSSSLAGCDALAINSSNGAIWAADYTANNNPIISASGSTVTTLSQNAWHGPWGQAFNSAFGGHPAFFATNATNGTVVRINIMPGPTFSFDTILSGLTYNNGAPGSILAPAGLSYNSSTDTLYVVDSNANRVIAIANATTAPANMYAATGSSFNTPNVTAVYSGAPLAAPISSALLGNGDLVVGNTTNNLLVEINPSSGTMVATKSVDSGAAGAIFGIAATVTQGQQYIYFNDDNTNTVDRLGP